MVFSVDSLSLFEQNIIVLSLYLALEVAVSILGLEKGFSFFYIHQYF